MAAPQSLLKSAPGQRASIGGRQGPPLYRCHNTPRAGGVAGCARFRRAPRGMQITAGLAVPATVGLAINWIYQVVHKPTELVFRVSGTLFKTPAETWREYGPIFRNTQPA
jgi:hypothetical protein